MNYLVRLFAQEGSGNTTALWWQAWCVLQLLKWQLPPHCCKRWVFSTASLQPTTYSTQTLCKVKFWSSFNVYVCVHACMCVLCACGHVCVCECASACVCVCVCICVHGSGVYVCVCICVRVRDALNKPPTPGHNERQLKSVCWFAHPFS